jgi:aquaporin NIP
MAMIYTLGSISGAHLNPAVTIAFTLAGGKLRQVLPYIVAQLAGAILVSGTLKLLFPANETLVTTLPAGTEGQSFILELILAFF